jgi:hypothetical protein
LILESKSCLGQIGPQNSAHAMTLNILQAAAKCFFSLKFSEHCENLTGGRHAIRGTQLKMNCKMSCPANTSEVQNGTPVTKISPQGRTSG